MDMYYSIKDLYLVKPSIVVYNKIKLVREDEYSKIYYQKIKLEQRPNDMEITLNDENNILNITGNYIIKNNTEKYDLNNKYINIYKNDKILLNKYLCKNGLKRLLKKEYTFDQLLCLLYVIKKTYNDDTIKVKKIERNYSKQKLNYF